MAGVNLLVAAESLKRRLTNLMDKRYDNIPLQQQFVTSIILNPSAHISRRLTVGNDQGGKKNSISPSKYEKVQAQLRNSFNVDQFDPNNINFISKFLNRGSNRGSAVSNKFDLSDPSILNNLEKMVGRSKALSLSGIQLQKKLSQLSHYRNSMRVPLNKEYPMNFERKIEHDILSYKDGKQISLIT
jgi:hypothetical protein